MQLMQLRHRTPRRWLARRRLAPQQRAAQRLNLPNIIAAAEQVMKEALNPVRARSTLPPKLGFQSGEF